jgi:Tfp pilus assembly protein PilF
MFGDNLKLLLRLYVRPRSTMSLIVDEGSLLFGALAVLAISLLLTNAGALAGATRMATDPAALQAAAGGDVPHTPGERVPALLHVVAMWAGLGSFSFLAGLAVLYVPAMIFVMTLTDRKHGSFGVALTRDYGSLAPCIFLSFAATELIFGLVWGAVASALGGEDLGRAILAGLTVLAAGAVYFAVLAFLAVRTVYGTGPGAALLAVVLPFLVMPFAGYLSLLASPFLLYFVYMYVRSDISAIQWTLGSRRAFKRHMEAATINPRDAAPHYQLGLIHQHRRQYPEAIQRFQKAVEIDPSEIDAYFQLGRIAREQGRHADAIRHFEQVVARDSKYLRHEIWREVGATYFDASDFANARMSLERYVENRPYDPEGLCLLGLCLKKLDEPQKAWDVLHQCVEATKTAPDYRRGELRRWRKRAEQEMKAKA